MPSKNHPFLVVVAGCAGNDHEKMEILGRLGLPKPNLAKVLKRWNSANRRCSAA